MANAFSLSGTRLALLRRHERVAKRPRNAERHVAHAVGAAGDGDVVLAVLDVARGVGHRLDRRRAGARNAEGVDVLRQARPEHDFARDVEPVERRHDLPVDAERDRARRDLGALDQLFDDRDAEVDGSHLAQPRPLLGERRAESCDDGHAIVRRHGAAG